MRYLSCCYLFLLLLSCICLKKNSIASVGKNNNSVHHCRVWEKINIKFYNKFNHKETGTVSLLRPEGYSRSHGLISGRQNIHIKKWMNKVNRLYAGIVEININILTDDDIKNKKISGKTDNKRNMVTGIYIYTTNNVFTWTFKNNHGNIFKIHATQNHPFYVKNLKKFLPLSRITSGMVLMNDHQDTVRLICPAGRRNHCGTPYHSSRVYDIEVSQQHQYFVSSEHVMVHNCQMNIPESSQEVTSSFPESNSSSAGYNAVNLSSAAPENADADSSLILPLIPKFKGKLLIGPRQTIIDNVAPGEGNTYGSIDSIGNRKAWGKYDTILIMPASGGLIKKLSGRINPGTEVYRLVRGSPDQARLYMNHIRNLHFVEILEPSAGMKVLRGFGVQHQLAREYSENTLVGYGCFDGGPSILKRIITFICRGEWEEKPDIVSYILKYRQSYNVES